MRILKLLIEYGASIWWCNCIDLHSQLQAKENGSSFARLNNLRAHERIHEREPKEKRPLGEKPFQCLICGKKFTERSSLKVHGRFHSDNNPFDCRHCGKKCSTPHQLGIHERIHTGEKPYSCATCGKAFNQLNHLQDHERLHTGEKPFVCRFCGKGFAQKTNMIGHEKIHNKS